MKTIKKWTAVISGITLYYFLFYLSNKHNVVPTRHIKFLEPVAAYKWNSSDDLIVLVVDYVDRKWLLERINLHVRVPIVRTKSVCAFANIPYCLASSTLDTDAFDKIIRSADDENPWTFIPQQMHSNSVVTVKTGNSFNNSKVEGEPGRAFIQSTNYDSEMINSHIGKDREGNLVCIDGPKKQGNIVTFTNSIYKDKMRHVKVNLPAGSEYLNASVSPSGKYIAWMSWEYSYPQEDNFISKAVRNIFYPPKIFDISEIPGKLSIWRSDINGNNLKLLSSDAIGVFVHTIRDECPEFHTGICWKNDDTQITFMFGTTPAIIMIN